MTIVWSLRGKNILEHLILNLFWKISAWDLNYLELRLAVEIHRHLIHRSKTVHTDFEIPIYIYK